ncbi:SusC/RagA family TonB-linked outer membrane protein [Sphingobacterium sp. MYb388]|uniref:SusC/RagA family TonB-linked outer membrane protein n=1 Tax=Sphingobacterium sp. MYb388 TaxID=2745437 RepID=UPI0030AEE565
MNNFYKDGRVHAYLKGVIKSIYTIINKCINYGVFPKYTIVKKALENNIAHATNADLVFRLYDAGEGMVILRDCLVPEYGLALQSIGTSLITDRQYTEQTVIKEHRKGKQGVTESARRSLQELKNKPRNGNESVINKQQNTTEIAEGKQRKTRKMRRLETSDFFLTNLTPTSKFLRLGFESASGFHRLQCMKSRSTVEQKSSGGRRKGQDREEKVSRSLLDVANSKSKHCPSGTRSIPAFNLLRTLFYLRTSLHRMCAVLLPSMHKGRDGAGTLQVLCSYGETYYKGKRRLKESPNKIRTNGFAFLLIFIKNVLAKIGLAVRSEYGLFTNALLKRYQKDTGNVLESYQRATEVNSLAVLRLACARQVREFGCSCVAQAYVMRMLNTGNAWIVRKTVPIYALLTHYQRFIYASSLLNPYAESALSKIRRFKRSNFFCWASEWFCINNQSNRLKCFSNQIQGGVRDYVNEAFVLRLTKSTFSAVLLLLLMMTFGSVSAQAQNKQNYVLQGTVISAVDKKPLQAVSVRVEADNVKTSTKKDGSFSVAVTQRTGKVKFTSVGYKTLELDYTSGVVLHVQLNPVENQLDEVEVVSTGYQKIPKERATGSFEVLTNEQLNISKSSHFINRLEGLSPSLRFEKRVPNLKPEEQLYQRGNSTLLGAWSPLIILDNFPYEGDLSNINPNDIENITILKDAAAASIWGTRSGNGVIVITSKSGSKTDRIQLDLSSNFQIGQKPDIYKLPHMSSKDFIESEEFLFENNYYDWMINYPDYTLSPIVSLLDKVRSGKIDQESYQQQKIAFEKNDVRDDYMNYIYRNNITQQYFASLAYGSKKMDFRGSLGFDKSLESIKNNNSDRISAKFVSSIRPTDRFSVDFNIAFSDNGKKGQGSDSKVGYGSLYSGAGKSFYPYLRLVDDHGVGIDLETVTFRKSYIDTLAGGRLFPERYNIMNELYASENNTRITDATLSIAASYKFSKPWELITSYQFQRSLSKTTNLESLDSYYTQHYINLYTQFTPNSLTYNVPVGDIYSKRIGDLTSHYLRAIVKFDKELGAGVLNVLGGAELKSMDNRIEGYKLYGYHADRIEFTLVDFKSSFPLLNGFQGRAQIFNGNKIEEYKQRFVSLFINGSYILHNRYVVSGSVRRDAANLFGVASNRKWQPLWSLGAAWEISKEEFFPKGTFSYLKLRTTYGVNGNITTQISAYPTIAYDGVFPYTGYTNAYMVNPPNPDYRAERVGIFNVGVDFAMTNGRINGNVEFYNKEAKDLVALANIDPTTGFYTQAVNIANFRNQGVELNLQSTNIVAGDYKWNSNLIFTYGKSVVTKYNYKHSSVSSYMWATTAPNPVVGRDLYGLYAFRFAGLDHETGAPLGYYNGEMSQDYSKIMSVGIEDVNYMGSSVPLYAGFLANTFSWRSWSLRANLQYKLKYFYRRQSINYNGLAQYWQMQDDFNLRWKKPGDEMHTNVPAFIYPMNGQRDQFYQNSEVLIEPADHVRLKDINLQYQLNLHSKSFRSIQLYVNADNLNLMVWRKSKYKNDPDFNFLIPTPRLYTIGAKASF